MDSTRDPPKTLTLLEAEILYAVWHATAANVPPGLKYKEMLNSPKIKATSMAMLKKTVRDLQLRSLITSHPDGSLTYPKGRRPQVYRLDYDHVPATLNEARILVIIHSHIQPPLFFNDLLALVESDNILRHRDVKDPNILLRAINHAHHLGYLLDPLDSPTSEIEIRGTPRLQAHITYLLKVLYHRDE